MNCIPEVELNRRLPIAILNLLSYVLFVIIVKERYIKSNNVNKLFLANPRAGKRYKMSTPLQLLANYYRNVQESERIYHENVQLYASPSGDSASASTESSSRVVEEMFLLQRQVSHLTAEIQSLSRENDKLKGLQATHKALMESKLNNSKKIIDKLRKDQQDNKSAPSKDLRGTPPPTELPKKGQAPFHLLSPLNMRKIDGAAKHDHISGASSKPIGLRQVLTGSHQTLFDGDQTFENVSADRTDDVLFVNSIKHKDELAKVVLPSEALSEDDDSQVQAKRALPKRTVPSGRGVTKKRKLIRKRIQTVNSDNEE